MTSRPTLFRVMRFLYAAWILGETKETTSPIPTDNRVWTQALAGLKATGDLPQEVVEHLTFIDGHTGLECLEVPVIQAMASDVGITVANPFEEVDCIPVSKSVGRYLASRLGLDPMDVASFGHLFRSALMQGYMAARA